MTKAEANRRARAALAHGTFACDADGQPDRLGVHRRIRLACGDQFTWFILYGLGGRPPSQTDMVRQLAAHLYDEEKYADD